MAKTQTKAAEPAAFEQTNTQSPFPFDVRIYGAKDNGTQRATATVNIGGIFAVRGVKVLEGSKAPSGAGLSRRTGNSRRVYSGAGCAD